mgnify:CR=1 FL=1
MKKVLSLLAATLVAGSALADSAIEFKYLPTAGDKTAGGKEFTKDAAVEVAAGEVLAEGTNFTVYNAYKTTYKAVGMMTDTAYNTIKINDIEVDYKTLRIQGQDNPKDKDGGNPGLTCKVASQGACFRVSVKEKGTILAFIKTTPNKNFFVYEQVKENNGTVVGSALEYCYASMANLKSGVTYGDPSGLAQICYFGNEYGQMLTNANTPQSLYGTTDATNGVGFIAFDVDPEYGDYIVGTGGSKMMACGFAFVPKSESENLKITAIGCEDQAGTPHQDVQLLPFADNYLSQECGEILNEYKITMIAPDEWIVPADTTVADTAKWAYKCSCCISEGDSEGKVYEMSVVKKSTGKFPVPENNEYTYTYKTKAEKFNISFLCGTKFTTPDMCSLTVPNVSATSSTFTVLYNANGKCTIKDVENAYDGINSLSVENSKSSYVYNILGQRVPANTKGLVIVDGKKVIRK